MKNKKLIPLILQIYLPAFLMYVGWSMSIPVIPLYAREMGATLILTGLVVAVKGFGPLVLNIPSGILISKYGNRWILLVSSCLALFVAVGTGLTRSVAVLAIMSFLLGGTQTVWMLSRVNYVRAVVPVHQRGRAISAIGGINRIGGFIGPIIGGVIGKHAGLRYVFFAQAVIVLMVISQFLFNKTTKESGVTLENNGGTGLAAVRKVLSENRKSFVTVGVVTMAFQFIRTGRTVIFPLWGEMIGLDVAQIGLILGLISAIDMTLFYPAGTIMDKKGRKWTAVPSILIMALSFFLLPTAHTFGLVLVVGLLNGLGNGLGSGIVMTLGTDLSPKENAGEFLSIWFLVSALGGLVGPAIVGYVSDVLSMGAAAITTGGVGAAGGLFLFLFVKETLTRKKT